MTPATTLTIITGASRGLGAAMAVQLLKPGAHLICIARSNHKLLPTLAAQNKATLEQWNIDLADSASAAQRLGQWLAGQDPAQFAQATLINNAGVLSALLPLRDANAADVSRALRVGLEAPMLLSAAFLAGTRHWSATRKLLNISSGLGRRAMASTAPYCAAKAGLDHFTRCVALEEAQQTNAALVCSLAPGVVDTSMQDQLRAADLADFPDRPSFEHLHAHGQLSSVADAARRVLAFLARPDFGNQPVADVRE
jgi:benzil reductase ((S)-benzoin forming)